MRLPGSKHKDIDRWVQKGLIDLPTAKRLNAERRKQMGTSG